MRDDHLLSKWFSGHKLGQTPGDGEGQGNLEFLAHEVTKSRS